MRDEDLPIIDTKVLILEGDQPELSDLAIKMVTQLTDGELVTFAVMLIDELQEKHGGSRAGEMAADLHEVLGYVLADSKQEVLSETSH